MITPHEVNMAAFLRLLLSVGLLISCTDAYRVLIIFPLPVRSMNLLGEGYVRHLHNAGHEVTYVTPFPIKNPPKERFTQVDVSPVQRLFENEPLHMLDKIMESPPESIVYHMQLMAIEAAKNIFGEKNFQDLLADTSKTFDVVISDMLESEIYAGIAAVYDCPLIWAYSMGAHTMVMRLIEKPLNPSYAMDYYTANTPPFTLSERVEQLWAQLQWYFYKIYTTKPQEEAFYRKKFSPYLAMRGRALPDYDAVIYNASLVFSNEHHTVGNLPAVPLNFKFIGGFHIDENVKPLPKDLQDLMDNAKHGVIYFSMGSTWKSKYIPQAVKKNLLKLFGTLKQTVIWKYEETDLLNVPKNVYIMKWGPQQSILAHPNCVLFITHGGQLSSTEAIHFGVPIIGMPIFMDQFMNIKKAILKGYALTANLDYDMASNLKPAIEEMLSNPKYKEKAKELAMIYHHRPVPPGKELVHWVEHVVKTRGARHLQAPAKVMSFYEIFYLDLLALILAALVVTVLVIRRIINLLIASPTPARKQKKN